MALYKPNAGVEVPVPDPTVTPPVIGTASVYSNKNYTENAAGYIEGDSWTVTYFNTHYGNDDVASSNSDTIDPTVKMYTKINNLELRRDGALTPNTNETTGNTIITGQANMYPLNITPTEGDLFLAEYAPQMFGIFTITQVDRVSIFQQTAWNVLFVMTDMNPSAFFMEDLENKVVANLFFDMDAMLLNKPALYTESEVIRLKGKDELKNSLMEEYHIRFFRREHLTFVLPDSETFDPYLVLFWNKMMGYDSFRGLEAPREYSLTHSSFKTPYKTVWDAFANRSISTLGYCVRSMRETSTDAFTATYTFHTLSNTRMRKIIQPVGINEYGYVSKADAREDNGTTYIFSEAFYDKDVVNMNALEHMVYKCISGKELLDYNDVVNTLDYIRTQDDTVQYYGIPFILAMIDLSR